MRGRLAVLVLLLAPVCTALPGARRALQKHGPPTESEAASVGLGAPIVAGAGAGAVVAAAAVAESPPAQNSEPQYQSAPTGSLVTVVVPEGIGPGQAMVVTSADGTRVQVVVPAGVGPGQHLQVQMPPPAPAATTALPVAATLQQVPYTPPAAVPVPVAAAASYSAAEVPSGPQPVAFTRQAAADLPQHTVTIHGTPIKFAVTAKPHIALILGHIKRELHGYGNEPACLTIHCVCAPMWKAMTAFIQSLPSPILPSLPALMH